MPRGRIVIGERGGVSSLRSVSIVVATSAKIFGLRSLFLLVGVVVPRPDASLFDIRVGRPLDLLGDWGVVRSAHGIKVA